MDKRSSCSRIRPSNDPRRVGQVALPALLLAALWPSQAAGQPFIWDEDLLEGLADIISECTDADGDGYCTLLPPLDCDDTNDSSHPGAGELCDGLDNDCDGEIDEDFLVNSIDQGAGGGGNDNPLNGGGGVYPGDLIYVPALGEPCTASTGWCRSEGSYVCSPDGLSVVCDAIAPVPEAESCNNADDDCDGVVDEGCYLGTTCASQDALCSAAGVERISDTGDVVCETAYPLESCAEVDFVSPGEHAVANDAVRVHVVLGGSVVGFCSTVRVYVDAEDVTQRLMRKNDSLVGTLPEISVGWHMIVLEIVSRSGEVLLTRGHYFYAMRAAPAEPTLPETNGYVSSGTFSGGGAPNGVAQPPSAHVGALSLPSVSTHTSELLALGHYFENHRLGVDNASHAAVSRDVDFESAGPGGLDFKLERIYSSGIAFNQAAAPMAREMYSSTLGHLASPATLERARTRRDEAIEDLRRRQGEYLDAQVNRICSQYEPYSHETYRYVGANERAWYWVHEFDCVKERMVQAMYHNGHYQDRAKSRYENCDKTSWIEDIWNAAFERDAPEYICPSLPDEDDLDTDNAWDPRVYAGLLVSNSSKSVLKEAGKRVIAVLDQADLDTQALEDALLQLQDYYNQRITNINSNGIRAPPIHTALGEGWTFNIPFLVLPPEQDAAGYVFFDGYRAQSFASEEYAEFADERSFLLALNDHYVALPPEIPSHWTDCVDTDPFGLGGIDFSCMIYTPSEGDEVFKNSKLFDRNPPVIAGERRDDAAYRLAQRSRVSYFNAQGQLRYVTDLSHNNLIEYTWQGEYADNLEAIGSGKLASIRDAAGNVYTFEYADDPSFPPILESVQASYGKTIAYQVETAAETTGRKIWQLKRFTATQTDLSGVQERPSLGQQISYTGSYEYELGFAFDCEEQLVSPYGNPNLPSQDEPGSFHFCADVEYSLLETSTTPQGGTFTLTYHDRQGRYEIDFGESDGQGISLSGVVDYLTGRPIDPEEFVSERGLYTLYETPPSVHELWEDEELIATHYSRYNERTTERERVRGDQYRVLVYGTACAQPCLAPHRSHKLLYSMSVTKEYDGEPILRGSHMRRDWWYADMDSTQFEYSVHQYDPLGNLAVELSARSVGWAGDQLIREYEYEQEGAAKRLYGQATEVRYIANGTGRIDPATLPEGALFQDSFDTWALAMLQAERRDRAELLERIQVQYSDRYPWLPKLVSDGLVETTLEYSEGFSHDPSGSGKPIRILQTSEGNVLLTEYWYDEKGRVERVEQPGQRSVVTEYEHEDGSESPFPTRITISSSVDEATLQYGYAFNSRGLMLLQSSPDGSRAQWDYDAFGRLTKAIDPERARFLYYPQAEGTDCWLCVQPERVNQGFETIVELASSEDGPRIPQLKVRADGFGRQAAIREYARDHGGGTVSVITEWFYDDHGRVSQVDRAHSGARRTLARYGYDALGRVTSIVNAVGGSTQVAYKDALVETPINETSTALLRYRTVINPMGESTTEYLDTLGRLVLVRKDVQLDPEGNRETLTWQRHYDAFGRLSWSLDPDRVVTYRTYDSFHRPNGRITTKLAPGEMPDAIPPQCQVSDQSCGAVSVLYDDTGRIHQKTNAEGHTITYGYDGLGRIESVTDPLLNGTTYEYDVVGRQISITRQGVTQIRWYDALGRLTSIVDEEGNVRRFGYDLRGYLSRETTSLVGKDGLVRDVTRTWERGLAGKLVASTDEEGYRHGYAFDGLLDLVTDLSPRGEIANTHYTYEITDTGSQVLAIDADGTATQRFYDKMGRLSEIAKGPSAEALKIREAYSYNELGRILAKSDVQGGSTWRYAYDASGRLIARISPELRREDWTYDFLGRRTTRSLGPHASPVEQYVYEYDKLGNILSVLNPAGGKRSFTYDPLGRVKTTQLSGEEPRVIEYDDAARTRTVYDQNGQPELSEFNKVGWLVKRTDPLGIVDEYDYTSRGQLRWHRRYDKASPDVFHEQLYAYHPTGRLESVTRGGHSESFRFDPVGNLERYEDAMGLVTAYCYEASHNQPTRIERPGRYPVRYEYDEMLRPTGVVFGLGDNDVGEGGRGENRRTVIEYDDVRKQVTRITEAGTFVSTYTPDGNLQSFERPSESSTQFTEYDEANRLVRFQDSLLHVFSYDYNALGQMVGLWIDGEENGQRLSYDDHGKLASVTTAAGTRTYSYRADGRLDEITFPDGSVLGHGYYPNGWLEWEGRIGGEVRKYAYDIEGLVSEVVEAGFDGVHRLSFERNALGLVTKESYIAPGEDAATESDARYYPNGMIGAIGNTVYERDAVSGFISRIYAPNGRRGQDQRLEFDGFGQLVRRRTDEGYLEIHTYDAAGRQKMVEAPGFRGEITRFDVDGNPDTVELEAGSGVEYRDYDYDSEGRLSAMVSSVFGSLRYERDGAGNTSVVRSGDNDEIIETRIYDWSNRLDFIDTPVGRKDFIYDLRGRLDSIRGPSGQQGFGYDSYDRLRSVTRNGDPVRTLSYDPVGRVVKDHDLVTPEVKRLFFFGRYPLRLDGSERTRTVVPDPGSGRPLAVEEDGELGLVSWLFGSAQSVADSFGAPIAQQRRSPYGRLLQGEASEIPFGFKGYYQLSSSERHWTFARVYDAGNAAFLTADPLASLETVPSRANPWRVFSGDPLRVNDVLGLEDDEDCGPLCVSVDGSGQGQQQGPGPSCVDNECGSAPVVDTDPSARSGDIRNRSDTSLALGAGPPSMPAPPTGGTPTTTDLASLLQHTGMGGSAMVDALAEVDPAWLNFHCSTVDGESVCGPVVSVESGSVNLVGQGARDDARVQALRNLLELAHDLQRWRGLATASRNDWDIGNIVNPAYHLWQLYLNYKLGDKRIALAKAMSELATDWQTERYWGHNVPQGIMREWVSTGVTEVTKGALYGSFAAGVARVPKLPDRFGKDVALGLWSKNLLGFARKVGANTYKTWPNAQLCSSSIYSQFEDAFLEAIVHARRIHFSLDGMDLRDAWRLGRSGPNYVADEYANFTNWEFHTLLTSPARIRDKVIFYRGGQPMPLISVLREAGALE